MIRKVSLVIGMAMLVLAAHVASADSLSTKLPIITVRGESGDLNWLLLRYERTDSHEPLRIAIGDDLGAMTHGEKVQATGDTLYLGIIKEKGSKGSYKITVSEQ